MKIGDIASKPKPDPNASRTHWVELHSEILGTNFLLLYDKRHLPEARQVHPNLAVYFPPEIRELARQAPTPDQLRAIHFWKHGTKGWIIPKDMQRKDGLNYLPPVEFPKPKAKP